jgi:hypothetical protein
MLIDKISIIVGQSSGWFRIVYVILSDNQVIITKKPKGERIIPLGCFLVEIGSELIGVNQMILIALTGLPPYRIISSTLGSKPR